MINKRKVYCGADRLSELKAVLDGRRCGLLTAASGIDRFGVPTYVHLSEEFRLTVMFSPEHGVHSVLQDGSWSGEYVDPETGVPVYDLPAQGSPRISEALSMCDVVLYDIQDVGARFYTYVYCLTYLMGECAVRNIPVFILDRPNPISGDLSLAEGAILDEGRFSSFVGRYALPVRYSLTCGEFASYINDTHGIGCELHVIKCLGWERGLYGDELDLPWINPSPNIPSVNCAVNYIGTCLIEATNVSEGRGTTRPFDLVGAPFIDSRRLADKMNSIGLPGIYFSRAFFKPMFGKHAGQVCEGVQLNITDRKSYRPHRSGLYLLSALSEFEGFELKPESLNLRYGTDALTRDGTFDPAKVSESEKLPLDTYVSSVKKYLFY